MNHARPRFALVVARYCAFEIIESGTEEKGGRTRSYAWPRANARTNATVRFSGRMEGQEKEERKTAPDRCSCVVTKPAGRRD